MQQGEASQYHFFFQKKKKFNQWIVRKFNFADKVVHINEKHAMSTNQEIILRDKIGIFTLSSFNFTIFAKSIVIIFQLIKKLQNALFVSL